MRTDDRDVTNISQWTRQGQLPWFWKHFSCSFSSRVR